MIQTDLGSLILIQITPKERSLRLQYILTYIIISYSSVFFPTALPHTVSIPFEAQWISFKGLRAEGERVVIYDQCPITSWNSHFLSPVNNSQLCNVLKKRLLHSIFKAFFYFQCICIPTYKSIGSLLKTNTA